MMTRRDGPTVSGALGPSRRCFVRFTGLGLATALGRSLCPGAEAQGRGRGGLKRGDKVEIGGQAKEIIQKAYELGYRYEKQHGG